MPATMLFDIKPTPGNPRNSEGDTILLADGRLLLAWTRFEGREDHARAEVRAVLSSDWGTTWGEPRVLVSPDEAQQNVMSVSLLRERVTGELLLFYLRKNSLADLQVRVLRSSDEGASWCCGRRVSTQEGYNVMNNARVVQLESGRLLAPVAHTRDYAQSPQQVAFCYLSDDGGWTWRPGRGAARLGKGATGCQEPGLVPLHGGPLLMYIRTDLDCVYAALSGDDGETWGEPAPLRDLPAPAAPATMARLSTGRLIALYNHRPEGARAGWEGRTPLAAACSEDDGRTWRRLEDIESSADYAYGYTSIRLCGERAVLTYYAWPRSAPVGFEQTTLRFRVLPLSRFTG